MCDEIISFAAPPTKSEAIEMIEAALGPDAPDATVESILEDLAAERR